MSLIVGDLPSLLAVNDLPATRATKAYISGLFLAQSGARGVDLSKTSLTLAFQQARETYDFEKSQQLGDYVLWILSWYPQAVAAHRTLVETFGRLSYAHCFKRVPTWRVYEELADQLAVFAVKLHQQTTTLAIRKDER